MGKKYKQTCLAGRQVTVIGPIGSGKTTASQLLARELDLPLLDADLYETNPFLESYIKDTPRWSFATELFFTINRIKKLLPLREILRHKSVVVDSGLIMSHQVYAKNHLVQGTMTAAEWEFFQNIIADYKQAIPAPDLVVYLTCDPQVQEKRIKARGRSFESGYTLDYLQNITDRLNEYVESISNHEGGRLCTSSAIAPEKCIQMRSSLRCLTFDSEQHNITTPSGAQALLDLIKPHLTLQG